MVILVSPLSQLTRLVASRTPERIVSLLDPDAAFPEFGSAYAGRHLRLRLHDVHASTETRVAATSKHIEDLLVFLAQWRRGAPLLIHCRAGMGRSPAAAFIAACFYNPAVDELEIASALRRISPTSRPNESLIGFADAALGRSGRMTEAIAETGRGLVWPDVDEGYPFELPAVISRHQDEQDAAVLRLRVPGGKIPAHAPPRNNLPFYGSYCNYGEPRSEYYCH